jgi:hypothetical protein
MTPLQLQWLHNFERDKNIINADGIAICIEAIQASIEILLQHLPEETEENYELGHNKRSVTRPTFVYKFGIGLYLFTAYSSQTRLSKTNDGRHDR